jgi:hypothetical protein
MSRSEKLEIATARIMDLLANEETSEQEREVLEPLLVSEAWTGVLVGVSLPMTTRALLELLIEAGEQEVQTVTGQLERAEAELVTWLIKPGPATPAHQTPQTNRQTRHTKTQFGAVSAPSPSSRRTRMGSTANTRIQYSDGAHKARGGIKKFDKGESVEVRGLHILGAHYADQVDLVTALVDTRGALREDLAALQAVLSGEVSPLEEGTNGSPGHEARAKMMTSEFTSTTPILETRHGEEGQSRPTTVLSGRESEAAETPKRVNFAAHALKS